MIVDPTATKSKQVGDGNLQNIIKTIIMLSKNDVFIQKICVFSGLKPKIESGNTCRFKKSNI